MNAIARRSLYLCFIGTIASAAVPIERISVNAAGVQGNRISEPGSIADGGNIVAFTSGAFNLVPGDFDDGFDFSYAMIRDRQGNSTNWVVQPAVRTRSIGYPVLSRDAAFVVFYSQQANLVPGDTSSPDYFRKNLVSGEVVRVNQPPAGGNSNGQVDEYARVTADGRFVAFASPGSDLVAGDTNGVSDIFVRDMNSNVIERVSVGSNGEQALGNSTYPWISGDGRFVAFASLGTQLGMAPGVALNVFVRDRVSNTTSRVSVGVGGVDPNGTSGFGPFKATISDDGRWVSFGSIASNLVAGDTNGRADIFLTDRTSGTTTRVSTGLNGEQLTLSTDQSAMSGDGSRIIYSIQVGLTGNPLILFDRPSGLRIPLNRSPDGTVNGRAIFPSISADGQFVAVRADDAIVQQVSDGNDDVFLFDLRTVMQIFKDGFE